MAYSTGTGSTIQDLFTAIRNFAQGLGFEVKRFSNSQASPPQLSLGARGKFFNFQAYHDNQITSYASGSQATRNNYKAIYAGISTGWNDAEPLWWKQPGALYANESSNFAKASGQVYINDVEGDFVGWHLFGDAVTSDEQARPFVHVVIQTATDRYQHFSFGFLDQRGLSHDGVAYIHGQESRHYISGSADPTSGQAGSWAQPALGMYCFNMDYTGSFQMKVGDALPIGAGWVDRIWTGGNGQEVIPRRLINNPNSRSDGSGAGRLLSPMNYARGLTWSGHTVLFPMPVLIKNDVLSKTCYLGDFPQVRALNMEGLAPRQEIELPGQDGDEPDIWMVFPQIRQASWELSRNALLGRNPTSGHYGLAYKKN